MKMVKKNHSVIRTTHNVYLILLSMHYKNWPTTCTLNIYMNPNVRTIYDV